jgi:hypothetical protein
MANQFAPVAFPGHNVIDSVSEKVLEKLMQILTWFAVNCIWNSYFFWIMLSLITNHYWYLTLKFQLPVIENYFS